MRDQGSAAVIGPAADLRPVLLGVDDVARLLSCGRTMVYQLIRSGRLPAIKLGALTRVPISSVDEFVAQAVIEAQQEREYTELLYGSRMGRRG